MSRPRVLVETWTEDGVQWFGVRFGYPEFEPVDAERVTMMIKEALLAATQNQ